MKKSSLKEKIPDIGNIEYKIASTRKELEQAMNLVYKEYLSRGFILEKNYKSKLRITPHHIVPGATTFIGLKDGEVVITNSIIPNSPLGLPMDIGYKKEIDNLRKRKRKLCEAGYLATKSELFSRGLFSMFNFNKLNFIFTLFKILFQYAIFHKRFDDICIVTNPKHTIFKFLPFETIGKVKYYGYDYHSVKKKAAVPKRLDLSRMRKEIKDAKNISPKISYKPILYKIFLDSRVDEGLFINRYDFSYKDLRRFFVEKSGILKKLSKKNKQYIKESYSLTQKQFDSLLK